MDSFTFEEIEEQTRSVRSGRSKPVKRKWREIEAVKERQRLQKELADIDLFGHYSADDLNF